MQHLEGNGESSHLQELRPLFNCPRQLEEATGSFTRGETAQWPGVTPARGLRLPLPHESSQRCKSATSRKTEEEMGSKFLAVVDLKRQQDAMPLKI